MRQRLIPAFRSGNQPAFHAVLQPFQRRAQKGMTLRRLMCEAVEAVLGGECAPKDALRLVQAAMEAM